MYLCIQTAVCIVTNRVRLQNSLRNPPNCQAIVIFLVALSEQLSGGWCIGCDNIEKFHCVP